MLNDSIVCDVAACCAQAGSDGAPVTALLKALQPAETRNLPVSLPALWAHAVSARARNTSPRSCASTQTDSCTASFSQRGEPDRARTLPALWPRLAMPCCRRSPPAQVRHRAPVAPELSIWQLGAMRSCFVALSTVAMATCACCDSKAPRGRAAGH
jgi:hypothetical protein